MLIFTRESNHITVAKPRNARFGHLNGPKFGFFHEFLGIFILPQFDEFFSPQFDEKKFVKFQQDKNSWKNEEKCKLCSTVMAKPPISGLSNINMIQFFGKNEQIPFYKVITEIGSLAARISQASQGRISKRADPSK